MAKRIKTATFQRKMGKISKLLAEDDRVLYVIVENRVKPERSMVVLNIEWFGALVNSVEDGQVADEARVIKEALADIKRRSSNSFRQRVMSRFE